MKMKKDIDYEVATKMEQSLKSEWTSSCAYRWRYDVLDVALRHVETVALLSRDIPGN